MGEMGQATLQRVAAGDSAVTDALHEDGGVIVESLLGDDVVARINAEVQPELDRIVPGNTNINPIVDLFFGSSVRHLSSLAAHSPTFADTVIPHPLLRAVCDEFLLPNCSSYILNLAHLMDRGPGATLSPPIVTSGCGRTSRGSTARSRSPA